MDTEKMDYRTRMTRMMIRQTFMGMLSTQPIQSITVKALCEKTQINRGTFYTHYKDIYDLLYQIEQEMKIEFQNALTNVFTMQDRDPIKVMSHIFHCLQDHYDLCQVTLGKYGDKKFMEELLELGRKHYLEIISYFFPNSTNDEREYFYAFVSNGCIGLLQKWLSDGMVLSIEEVSSMGEAIMRKGMGFFLS